MISEEQKLLVAELATANMSIKDIAEASSIPVEFFIDQLNDENSELYHIYKSSVLTIDAMFLKKVADNAKIGIPQSQVLLHKLKKRNRH